MSVFPGDVKGLISVCTGLHGMTQHVYLVFRGGFDFLDRTSQFLSFYKIRGYTFLSFYLHDFIFHLSYILRLIRGRYYNKKLYTFTVRVKIFN